MDFELRIAIRTQSLVRTSPLRKYGFAVGYADPSPDILLVAGTRHPTKNTSLSRTTALGPFLEQKVPGDSSLRFEVCH